MEQLSWLAVVRHGQSVGNVAAQDAESSGLEVIDLAARDADVPLSDTGREQAEVVREVLADLRPDAAVVSTYLRARQTAEIASPVKPRVDERLRDRELGVLDLLTARGVQARLPAEAERRAYLGKFYYRPPGGESWADVLLRLRSLLRDLRDEHPGGRVVLFAHEATVWLIRYLLEELDEERLMAAAHGTTIANCSLSSWQRNGGGWQPENFNHVGHLHEQDAPVTKQEDVNAEPV